VHRHQIVADGRLRMYRYWKQDPKSVHVSWATYFAGLDKGLPSSSAYTPPPGFIGTAGSVPVPADGSPKMDLRGDDAVTDYLKVRPS
jgi:2-oxoglutarate dehydrogenase E1 component